MKDLRQQERRRLQKRCQWSRPYLYRLRYTWRIEHMSSLVILILLPVFLSLLFTCPSPTTTTTLVEGSIVSSLLSSSPSSSSASSTYNENDPQCFDDESISRAIPRGGGGGRGNSSGGTNRNTILTQQQKSSSSSSLSSLFVQSSSFCKDTFHAFGSAIHEARQHLVAAAVARSSAILSCYPIETVKTRIQTSQSLPFRIDGLYRGVGSSLLGQIPYTVLTFGSYEMYKKQFQQRFPNLKPIFTYAISAVLGDLTGSFWLCPPEVIKQQMQIGRYQTTIGAAMGVWQKDGIRGFYRGYLGSISRDVPFRVAQLTTYEVAKGLYLKHKIRRRQRRKRNGNVQTDDVDLSPAESAILGGLAGVVSTIVTQPMDRVRTLLMTNADSHGGSMVNCIKTILKQDGIGGLYAGVIPRVAYIGPSVAIFFIAYEKTIQLTKHW